MNINTALHHSYVKSKLYNKLVNTTKSSLTDIVNKLVVTGGERKGGWAIHR